MGACASQKKKSDQPQTMEEQKQNEQYQSILNTLKKFNEQSENEIEDQQIIPVLVVIKSAPLYKNNLVDSTFQMTEKDLRIDGKKITNSLKYYRPFVANNKN